jgi:hypothetical protein
VDSNEFFLFSPYVKYSSTGVDTFTKVYTNSHNRYFMTVSVHDCEHMLNFSFLEFHKNKTALTLGIRVIKKFIIT